MLATLTARELMNRDVMTVRDDLTLEELATFLTENQITGAPVVDARGKLVGLVSATDVTEIAMQNGEPARPEPEGGPAAESLRGLRVKESGRLVREIMTPTVFTVPEETPISELARTMIAGRIHRLLVTHGGHIVGIVTALDLLKLLAEE